DGAGGEVDADERGVRERERQGDQVAAVAAAEFEEAAALDGGGRHAEQGGEGGEAVGVRLWAAARGVGDGVVRGRGGGGQGQARKEENAVLPGLRYRPAEAVARQISHPPG